MKADFIIHNASLITCSSKGKAKKGAEMSDLGIIENGAVAILGEEIAAIGRSFEILRDFECENLLDANCKTVSPAFVECHTHIVFAGNRLNEFELKIKGADYLEILENGGGILSTVRQTREASLAELIEQSRKRLDKLLNLGVTTCEVKTGYGLDTETELKMLDAIFELDKTHEIDLIPTLLPAHAVPPEFKENADKYVELICGEMLPKAYKNFKSQILNLRFSPTFSVKKRLRFRTIPKGFGNGKRLGFGIKAHVDQFTNLGGARLAIELGAVSIDHLDAISDEEIKLLAGSETIGVITPTCNFNFGETKFADARRLIDAGCAVALSTDYNPGSAPCPSLPNAMAIACRYQKLLPGEAFNAATINGAFAVGLVKKTGSIEPGKQADILIFDTKDYREIAYEFGGNLVEVVIKSGKIVKE